MWWALSVFKSSALGAGNFKKYINYENYVWNNLSLFIFFADVSAWGQEFGQLNEEKMNYSVNCKEN